MQYVKEFLNCQLHFYGFLKRIKNTEAIHP